MALFSHEKEKEENKKRKNGRRRHNGFQAISPPIDLLKLPQRSFSSSKDGDSSRCSIP
jgi:hypothetical protein